MAPKSKTQKIVDEYTEEIRSGRLKSGDRLPGTTEMLQKYGVGVMTVRTAIGQLKAAGLIETVPGVGTFVK